MATFTISLLNALSYSLLLFMLSAGMTVIYSLMGVLNFAHASFYMLGAYLAWSVSTWLGFWPALVLAPLGAGVLGALLERHVLRRVHRFGQLSELLLTFGLSLIMLEAVQLVWGQGVLDYRVPAQLDGPMFVLYGAQFPAYRVFMMAVSLLTLALLAWWWLRSRHGLVLQAALTHPEMAQALGHDVPRLFMGVFGAGCALAALAGVLGGNAFVTEPGMAAAMGSLVFVVVVVGGMGSLWGSLLASLLIGLLQTFAVAIDAFSPIAPVLPYLLLVLTLLVRSRGLLGRRET